MLPRKVSRVLFHKNHKENLQGLTTGDQKRWRIKARLTAPVLRSWQNVLLLASVLKQRSQPVALPICRAKLVALSG